MPADLATRIADLARRRYGEQGARVVRAILQVEGGLTGNVGDGGQSFGPFQFHTRGMLPAYAQARGLTLPQAAAQARQSPLDAATWALDGYLGEAIAGGKKAGLQGAELATYVQRNGQRSEQPERAGQAYAALYGGTTTKGGEGMPDVTPPNQREENLKAIDEYIAALQAEKRQLETDYQAAAAAAARADAAAKVSWDQDALAAASATAAEVTRLRAEIGNVNAALRSANSARSTTARQVVKPTISPITAETQALVDNTVKGLQAEISAGKLSEESARNRLDDVMRQAQQGATGVLQAHNILQQAALRLGNAQTVQAIQAALRGWEKYGGAKMPEGDFLPLIPFDPQGAVAPYLPPAPDWKSALTAPAPAQPDMAPYLGVLRGALLPPGPAQPGPAETPPYAPSEPDPGAYGPGFGSPAAWGQDALDRTRTPEMPAPPPDLAFDAWERNQAALRAIPAQDPNRFEAPRQRLERLPAAPPSPPTPLPIPTPSPVGPPGFAPSPSLPRPLPGETEEEYWQRIVAEQTGGG